MQNTGLWKYCTKEQCNELILSFKLLGDSLWPPEKQLRCLYTISNHIDHHYKPVKLRKEDGSFRTLHVPDPLLKKIQRNILHHVLEMMPISSHAAAYHKGATIVGNAGMHAGKKQLLKLDLHDFFGTIVFPMVYKCAFSSLYFPPMAGTLLTYLCCYRDRLPQGAPTSAAISNLVMKPFDDYMGKWCKEKGIVFTRYCDDMTFSGDFDAKQVKAKAVGFLQEMGFTINERKTKLQKSWGRQSVTGVVVNCKPQVPSEYRRKLRQELYYCRKYGAASHLQRTGGTMCPTNYLLQVLGKVNFILHVNPSDTYFQDASVWLRQMLSYYGREEWLHGGY